MHSPCLIHDAVCPGIGWTPNTTSTYFTFHRLPMFLLPIILFQDPSGAQGVKMSTCLSVCLAQVCLKALNLQSFSHRSVSGLSQVCLMSVLELSQQISQVNLSDRRILKYFVLFNFSYWRELKWVKLQNVQYKGRISSSAPSLNQLQFTFTVYQVIYFIVKRNL